MHTHTLTKFRVVDFTTGKVMGVFTSRRTALRKADALDRILSYPGHARFNVEIIAITSATAVSGAESVMS